MNQVATITPIKSGLELVVDDPNVSDGSVFLRWCVCDSILRAYKDQGFKADNLFLLIVLVHKKTEKQVRYVFKLNDLMGCISFYSSGKHTILATVVVGESLGSVKNIFLRAHCDFMYRAVLLLNDSMFPKKCPDIFFDFEYLQDNETQEQPHLLPEDFRFQGKEKISAYMDVEVPDGVFAREWPPWVKTWANRWFSNPPLDQCDFRKRLILSVTTQPFIVLPFWIGKFLVTLLVVFYFLLTLRKNINFKPLWYLDKYDISDVYWNIGSSYWLKPVCYKKTSIEYLFRPIYIVPIILGFSLFLFTGSTYTSEASILEMIIYISITVFKLLSISLAFSLILYFLLDTMSYYLDKRQISTKNKKGKFNIILSSLNEAVQKIKEGMSKERELSNQKKEELKFENLVQTLSCDGPLEAKIKSLPRVKQSISLRFNGIKRKICKPFARF